LDFAIFVVPEGTTSDENLRVFAIIAVLVHGIWQKSSGIFTMAGKNPPGFLPWACGATVARLHGIDALRSKADT